MIVKVLSLKSGVEVLENIVSIKINSKKYNLLIMKNYTPIIGEINGTIEIQSETTNKKYEDIIGYYLNIDNEFRLMLKE